MFFQNLIDQRVVLVFTTELIIITVNIILMYVTLKRKKNKSAIMLSSFYASQILGFAIVLLSLIRVSPFAYFVYETSVFIVTLGMPALTLFTVNLLRKENPLIKKVQAIYLTLCIIISIYLFFLFPEGITLDETTGWIPVYSWSFFFTLVFFITCAYILPETYLLVKIYKNVQDNNIKVRIRLFFLGISLYIAFSYGIAIYNTWIDNYIYRTVYAILAFFIVVPGALIYFGIRKNLE